MASSPKGESSGFHWCAACRLNFPSKEWKKHPFSKQHLNKLLWFLQEQKEYAQKHLSPSPQSATTNSEADFSCIFCEEMVALLIDDSSSAHPRSPVWDHIASQEHNSKVYAFWHDSGAFRLSEAQLSPMDFTISKKQRQRLDYKARKSQEALDKVTAVVATEVPPQPAAEAISRQQPSTSLFPILPAAIPSTAIPGPGGLSVIQVPETLRLATGSIRDASGSATAIAPWRLSPAPGVTLISHALYGSKALQELASQYRLLLKASKKNPNRIGAAWANERLRQLAAEPNSQQAAPESFGEPNTTVTNAKEWLPSYSGMWSDGSVSRSQHKRDYTTRREAKAPHKDDSPPLL